MEAEVHCPACGGTIVAPIRPEAVKLSRMGQRVEVFFASSVVEHVCMEDSDV